MKLGKRNFAPSIARFVMPSGYSGSGVYLIRCMENNFIYCGLAMDLNERWRWHHTALRQQFHDNKKLRRDYLLYGESSFEFRLVFPTELIHEAKVVESKFIRNLKLGGKCYNVQEPVT